MANPLTKKTQDGQLYTRPANIDAAINAASVLDLDELSDRAQIANRDSPRFCPWSALFTLSVKPGALETRRS
jgi:hypothetical protein